MPTKRDVILVCSALVAGLFGGAVSNELRNPEHVAAQSEVSAVSKARSFSVVDEDDRERASLDPRGLVLKDAAGADRFVIRMPSQYRDQVALEVFGKGGRKGLEVIVSDESGFQSVRLAMHDSEESERVVLAVSDIFGSVKAQTRDERFSASLAASDKGAAFVSLSDDRKVDLRAPRDSKFSGINLSASSTSGLGLKLEHDSKERVSLELTEDGSPSFTLRDQNETSRAVLGVTELATTRTQTETRLPESSLTLFDDEGTVLQTLP